MLQLQFLLKIVLFDILFHCYNALVSIRKRKEVGVGACMCSDSRLFYEVIGHTQKCVII